RVPYTSHNSSASIIFEMTNGENLAELFLRVKEIMLSDFQLGSDPGLCLAVNIPETITLFGRKAKTELVTQAKARSLALQSGIMLEGLGGTQDGVIGALAAVGLSSGGFDGRYVRIGNLRQLKGEQTFKTILAAGVNDIQTVDGARVPEGVILSDKLRPSRRGYKAILYVEKHEDGCWYPLKLD
ncbi:MAG: ABC transporter substrate-binding protein, partial [Ignavibacteria bacterium]|nr:ABC transporter substrate-binding protein [Ignavibacteria bacterium]